VCSQAGLYSYSVGEFLLLLDGKTQLMALEEDEIRQIMFYVYILQCADGKHYVGYTADFRKRMIRHRRGEVNYTSSRLPVTVVVVIGVPDKYIAIRLEDYLKSGSGRAFARKHLLT
jgi:predicted GIY-YIG superfamily endonuclease